MAMMDAWFDAKTKGNYPVIGAVDDKGRLLGLPPTACSVNALLTSTPSSTPST